ncbi:XTP/dITP diphosphatase [Mechercharimyces sp. CAU 1602]|uniref:XTP/dITP diphosphatase n=1 Tax=Mechercharimyces sp. CAU 1602 TaxID=2973933 RepID=UPI0021635BA2|nr:XTP/dITP diphosphatase [Mechercharimyces sp. CAU 1602]MCS1351478.1 XTP/dITP diphosphatase [Mechercharimyces sp. CAU 1602]
MSKQRWMGKQVVLATRNKNKVRELNTLLQQELGLSVIGLDSFPSLPEVVEDRDTFQGNAEKKAEVIAQLLHIPVMADDSGLEVRALAGAPGVYSARYAGEKANDRMNVEKLLMELQGVPLEERSARFVCVLSLAVPGVETISVEGTCAGVIAEQPQGEGGFGYDPIFYLPDMKKTMAQVGTEVKNKRSHRAEAARKMVAQLYERFTF